MNKKIYFNNKFLLFSDSVSQDSQNQQIRFYAEISHDLLNEMIEDLLSENDISFQTRTSNFDQVFNYLKIKFKYIEAAGGFINKENEYLFIYRLQKWDLPKGKLDKGETIEQAAIRECEEECAISNLKIEKQLSSTYHIYTYKGNYALKQTFWFYMTTDYDQILIPQTEENIEEVRWFTAAEIKNTVYSNSYHTIIDVVNEAMNWT